MTLSSKRLISFSILFVSAVNLHAEIIESGYFKGKNISSVTAPNLSPITKEPAAVFVFESSAETNAESQKFNEWVKKTKSKTNLAIWGLVKVPSGTSKELVEEAVRQRNLDFPLYYTSEEVLHKTHSSVLLINNGKVQKSFPIIADSELDQAINSLRIITQSPAENPPSVSESSTQTLTTSTADLIKDLKEVSSDSNTDLTSSSIGENENSVALSGDGVYFNSEFNFSLTFPESWNWVQSANADGAVGKSNRSQVEFRAWGTQLADMYQARPSAYIQNSLKNLEKQTANPVTIERELMVSLNGNTGSDVIYNFSKPLNPDNLAQGYLRYKGRIQVFIINGIIKAISSDGPINEYNMNSSSIDSMFDSFDPNPANTPVQN